MQNVLSVVGKMLLMLGVLWASLSAGGTFSSRVAEIAKGRGHGQHVIRRAVIPPGSVPMATVRYSAHDSAGASGILSGDSMEKPGGE